MADERKTVDLGLLEEDDEFEEFPREEWDSKEEDHTDVNVWEDNWDDDNIEDDFSIQLSKFGRKRSLSQSYSSPQRAQTTCEPAAKKLCSRLSPTVPSPSRPEANGTNGHSNGAGDTTRTPARRSSRRRGGADEEGSSSPASRTPTRSSARLRSSRK